MDQLTTADEWELSKENVQPLRQGRKFSRLTEGLQPQSNERLQKIREEKQYVNINIFIVYKRFSNRNVVFWQYPGILRGDNSFHA